MVDEAVIEPVGPAGHDAGSTTRSSPLAAMPFTYGPSPLLLNGRMILFFAGVRHGTALEVPFETFRAVALKAAQ